MQAWLRVMSIPHTLCKRCVSWAGRRHGYTVSLNRPPFRTIVAALSTHPSPENEDEAAYAEFGELHKPAGLLDSRKRVRGIQKASRAVGKRALFQPGTADEFARLMSSPQDRAKAHELLDWFTIAHDDGRIPIRNVSYYSKLEDYPHANQYPELPPTLFHRPLLPAAYNSLYNSLKNQAQLDEVNGLVKRPRQYIWRHRVTVRRENSVLEGIGEDETKENARIAAFMHLVYQMHGDRHLEGLSFSWPAPEMVPPVVQPDMDAKLHVFNYAAKFGLMPTIHSHQLEDGNSKVTISVPELKIKATSIGRSVDEAEALACNVFKEEAEKQHKSRSRQPLILRGSSAVNLDNALDIMAYYDFVHPTNKFLWQRSMAKSNPQFWSCRIWRDKKPLTPAAVMPTYSKAKRLASLMAAVILTQEDSDFLTRFYDAVYHNGGVVPRRVSPAHFPLNEQAAMVINQALTGVEQAGLPTGALEPMDPLDQQSTEQSSQRALSSTVRSRKFLHSTTQSTSLRSEELKKYREVYMHDPRTEETRTALARLPINQYQIEILNMIKDHNQCVVVGTAGSGKSTQIPQIILNDAIADGMGAHCNIICSQPRRLAAVSLALRVCQERNEQLGEVAGYRISGDTIECQLGGSITFCTSEILILQLENSPDEILGGTSHIVIDEIHERDDPTDRLLLTIKLVFTARLKKGLPVPKLVLMSATTQSEAFERYLELTDRNGTSVRPPMIEVPGRQFPVKHKFLGDLLTELGSPSLSPDPDSTFEILKSRRDLATSKSQIQQYRHLEQVTASDNDALPPIIWESQFELNRIENESDLQRGSLVTAIAHIARSTEDGSILVFLPGWKEITQLHELLIQGTMGVDFADPEKFSILLLHSSNPTAVADAMGNEIEGCRKILLATDIAETSLTFVDVKYVVDSGRQRRPEYNTQIPSINFYRRWISKANLVQRAGRIGRVQPGEYYGVFSKEQQSAMPPFPAPNAVSSGRIQLSCLRARLHFPSVPIYEYFTKWLAPPPVHHLDAALRQLRSIGALTEDGNITNIGRALCRLGMAPSVGRMILLGVLFRCLDPVLASASFMGGHSQLFVAAQDKASQQHVSNLRQAYSRGSKSDVISALNAYREFVLIRGQQGAQVAYQWATERHLLFDQFKYFDRIVGMGEAALSQLGLLVPWERHNLNVESKNQGLIKALIMVGLYPNLAIHESAYRFLTRQGIPANLWLDSLTRPAHWRPQTWKQNPLKSTLCCYDEMLSVHESEDATFLSGTTPVSPLAAALFCNSLHVNNDDHSILMVDGWIPFKIEGGVDAARSILEFKQAWDKTLTTGLQRMCSPQWTAEHGNFEALKIMVQTIADLLEQDERQRQEDIGPS